MHDFKGTWWKSNSEMAKWGMKLPFPRRLAREQVAALIENSSMAQLLNQCHSGTNSVNPSKRF